MTLRDQYILEGAAAMAERELLSLVLGTRPGAADRLLKDHAGICGLMRSEPGVLAQVPGIGRARAVQLHAALQLGWRAQCSGFERVPIDGPATAWEWLKPLFVGAAEERLGALFLDRRNRVLARRVITVGTPSYTLVDPGQIFRLALSVEAHALVLGHNHPSGDPTPSREDLAVTRRVVEAGELLGISLVDHVVLGANCYISLAEEGVISR